ncbi:MAG TPA: hypothetical protein VN039_12890, partial [Nitrospira sp.]|nr:hypothetical protein [Nitrospira sp.]
EKKQAWEEVAKSRGVDRGELTRERVEEYFHLPLGQRMLKAKLTRFVGIGIALSQSFARWRMWEVLTKELHLWPMGKRVPLEDRPSGWSRTICPIVGGMSHEYPVEWINANPEMSELVERRESGYDWD